MPEVTSGLTYGDATPEFDVNTDAGFNASLAATAAVQSGEEPDAEKLSEALEGLRQGDRSVERGLEESPQGQPRDERGRFTEPAAPTEPEVPKEGAAPQTDEGGEQDPLESFLSRYAGNRENAEEVARAAAKEAEEAQSLLGRQGNEVGDLRKQNQDLIERLARLEGRLEAQPQQQPAPQPQVPVTYEQLDEMIAGPDGDGAGGQQAWIWAANNRPDLLGDVLEIWKDYDAYNAAVTRVRYEQNLARLQEERAQPKEEPKPDPLLAELHQQRSLEGAVESVRSRMNEGDWNLIKEHLIPVLTAEETPVLIKNMIASTDQATQEQGISVLVELAKGRVVASALARDERKAEVNEVKKKTAIATGSQRPAGSSGSSTANVSDLSKEERHQEFVRRIFEAPTKSVQEGLTYGPAQ
jgi:hypothetical protein